MASENIKSIEDMRKKNDKDITEKADIESKLRSFCWINDEDLNNLENILGQVYSSHIKTKGLKISNNQMQQENSHMMEKLGHFEILEEKLRYEVMNTQS